MSATNVFPSAGRSIDGRSIDGRSIDDPYIGVMACMCIRFQYGAGDVFPESP